MNATKTSLSRVPEAPHNCGGRRPPFRMLPLCGAMLAAHVAIGALPAHAEDENRSAIELIEVRGDFRGNRVDSPKYSRPLLDTPRIITVIPQDLLEIQNVTNFRDAMRNVSGISLQAGEGNPPGGDQLKIRGFNARDDLNVNGVRDVGNYFRDPFYVEQIEVIKGPNSAFSGRGSAGGTVNFVTKKPQLENFADVDASLGSDQFRRVTADVNRTLSDRSAMRVNLMGHDSEVPGRDALEDERFGAYISYGWGLETDTSVMVDYLLTQQDNLTDAGIPFDRETRPDRGAGTGAIPDIDFSNFYGHTDDRQEIRVDQFGILAAHRFNDQFAVRNHLRYTEVDTNSIVSSPRIRTATAGSVTDPLTEAQGDVKPRDQVDEVIFNQTDLLVSLETGRLEHDLVFGFEFGDIDQRNARRPDASGPRTNLFEPERRTGPEVFYDGSVHRFEAEMAGVYLLDTIRFSPQWDLNLGLRYDRVEATASESGHELGLNGAPARPNIEPLTKTDKEWSWSVGLVYKPVPDGTLYASVGTAFENSGTFDRNQVQLAGGAKRSIADDPTVARPRDRAVASADTFLIDPEETVAYELGVKWDVLTSLALNAALFRTEKTNARTPSVDGSVNTVLDGEQRIQGFELVAAGRISPEWRIYAGYTYMDSEVLESNNAFEEGQRLGGTPEHTLNLYTLYDVNERLSLGAGFQYVDEQVNNVQTQPLDEAFANGDRIQVGISSYTLFDAVATWRFSEQLRLRVNAQNLFDEDYIAELAEGGAQGRPGPTRQLTASLRYTF